MRIKGRVRELEKGVWSMYPATREEAFIEGVAKFWPRIPCPVHGGSPVVYTVTGINGCCAQYGAVDDYNHGVYVGEPASFSDAKLRGFNYYWKPQEHPGCGHSGRTLLDGTCFECAREKNQVSPRQAALAAGKTWYTPAVGDPCKAGHMAERRVSNGACKQCEAERAGVPEVPYYEANPDMVISRGDARALGLRYYRTGKPCKRKGHTGWRYVSTNNCVDCRKEVPAP